MSDKPSSESKVSSTIEASELVREIAGPMRLGDNVKTLLVRGHRKLAKHGFAFSRVRAIYHKDERIKISADEMHALRLARAKALEDEAGDELRELRRRIEKLESYIAHLENEARTENS